MRLLRLLSQNSAWQLATAIFASVLSGIAQLGATICVLEVFRSGQVVWWQFALVAALAVLIGRFLARTVARLTAQSIVRMRRRLVRSVLHLPLLALEAIGPTRLSVAFSSDLVNVASAVRNLAIAVRKFSHSNRLLRLYWLAVDSGDACHRIAVSHHHRRGSLSALSRKAASPWHARGLGPGADGISNVARWNQAVEGQSLPGAPCLAVI